MDLVLGLPTISTTFVGRAAAIEELRTLTSAPGLVTLVGPPGVGKTRLALELSVVEARATTAWVDLLPLTTSVQVVDALAGALGVCDGPGREVDDALAGALGHGAPTVVLDNCEHLADECAALVSALLERCPGLTVVATSRQALGVEGERCWPVPPLQHHEAIELFYARALSSQVGFEVDDEAAAAVREICTRLEGLPLAIELAAGRVAVLPPTEIAARLNNDAFSVLGNGNRSSDGRHHSLRGALARSHELLAPAEQVLFHRLSVFSGGFSFDATRAVCSGGAVRPASVRKLLRALVAKSLVVAEGADRFRLLQTTWLYASEQLIASGERDDLVERHLLWCIAFAEAVEPELTGRDQAAALARVDAELCNLRAAFDQTLTRPGDGALRLAASLTVWWRVRGRFRDGLRWLEAVLARDDEASQALMAQAYWGAGFLALMLHDERAGARLSRSLDLARSARDLRLQARSLLLLGNLAMAMGESPLSLLEQSVALASMADDGWCRVHALALIGAVHSVNRRAWQAGPILDDAVVTARRNSDLQGLRIALHFRAEVAWRAVDTAAAEAYAMEAFEVVGALRDPYGIAATLGLLAEIAFQRGHYGGAADHVQQSLAVLRSIGVEAETTERISDLGLLAFLHGDLAAARRRFDDALASASDPVDESCALRGLALVATEEHDHERATRLFDLAVAKAGAAGHRAAAAAALCGLARLASSDGQFDRAIALWRRALTLSWKLGDAAAVASTLEWLAIDTASSGRTDRAARLLAASSMVRSDHRVHREVFNRHRVDACVRTLRRRLGSQAFEDAWADGAAMTAHQAILHATKGHGRRQGPHKGWSSLTGAEQEVARLAAGGCSNPEIAARLWISRNTVQVHLSHVLTKLGIASRSDLTYVAGPRSLTSAIARAPDHF